MAKKHGGHHGGSWKVAYADFVTAMMALFLCLWLTAQDAKVKDAVERAFRNPFSSVTKESNGIIPSENASDGSKSSAQGQFQSATRINVDCIVLAFQPNGDFRTVHAGRQADNCLANVELNIYVSPCQRHQEAH